MNSHLRTWRRSVVISNGPCCINVYVCVLSEPRNAHAQRRVTRRAAPSPDGPPEGASKTSSKTRMLHVLLPCKHINPQPGSNFASSSLHGGHWLDFVSNRTILPRGARHHASRRTSVQRVSRSIADARRSHASKLKMIVNGIAATLGNKPVSYTHLTLPTKA